MIAMRIGADVESDKGSKEWSDSIVLRMQGGKKVNQLPRLEVRRSVYVPVTAIRDV